MITDNNKKLAQWAMDYALKNGCRAVKLALYSNSNASFELRDGKMDRLQQASESGLSISLYVDGKYGSYSTNRLDKKELESFIKNGIDSTRYLAVDEARVLPDTSRYYKGGKPDLQLFDERFETINPDDKVAVARAAAEEVLGKDSRVISVSTSYGDGENSSYRLMSNGFEGESKSTWFSVSADVALRGEGEARPSSYWYDSALFYDKLVKSGIGATALERALRKLGQKKVASGKYTMVVDSVNSSSLLRPMLSALYGSALQQKNSFLLDKLKMDEEAIAAEIGVLKTYFIDTYNSRKMGVEPTVDSPSLLVLKPGNKDLNGLVADVRKGILVTGFNGGNCNSSSGDFSYGIEGFLIENGKPTRPISEMNVTGNMITLWASLSAVGNDPRLSSSWRIPSLVFEDVDFSGL